MNCIEWCKLKKKKYQGQSWNKSLSKNTDKIEWNEVKLALNVSFTF